MYRSFYLYYYTMLKEFNELRKDNKNLSKLSVYGDRMITEKKH